MGKNKIVIKFSDQDMDILNKIASKRESTVEDIIKNCIADMMVKGLVEATDLGSSMDNRYV